MLASVCKRSQVASARAVYYMVAEEFDSMQLTRESFNCNSVMIIESAYRLLKEKRAYDCIWQTLNSYLG